MKLAVIRHHTGRYLPCLLLLFSMPATLVAQDSTGDPPPLVPVLAAPVLQFSLSVPADVPLWDTGITLRAGDSVEISASQGACNPAGVSGHEGWLESLPVSGANFGTLIGRLGQGEPFAIGVRLATNIQTPAQLFLGANTYGQAACSQHYEVEVSIRSQPDEAAAGNERARVISHLDRLPRRVTDAYGRPGDPLNFVLIGSYPAVRAALSAAHWSVADEKKLPAAVHAVLATWAREAYTQMPRSKLYCFERVQEFGYELANPIKVAARRHHFRLWLVPWQLEGTDVWIGAATHDIGFTRDRRNGHLTHKIDPNVDDEREFILHAFDHEVGTKSVFYFEPQDPVQEGDNATGEHFYSDGRVLVVILDLAPAR
jgi:hypothetical protein